MLCPSCYTEIGTWTDDPIRTPLGLNGADYIGVVNIRGIPHIQELQAMRVLQEEQAEIPESERTQFTEVNPSTNQITRTHINELRLSTEKILMSQAEHIIESGGREALLYRYFNYDTDGNYLGTTKNEWTDVDPNNPPSILSDETVFIRAIHIEDLRHPVPILAGLPEYPGVDFKRRVIEEDLQIVHTTFQNPTGYPPYLNIGDTITFNSDISVQYTDDWWWHASARYPERLDIEATDPSLITGTIISDDPFLLYDEDEVVFNRVYLTITTDGRYLFHYWQWDARKPEGEEKSEIWVMGDSPNMTVCDIDEDGNSINCYSISYTDWERDYDDWWSGSGFIQYADISPYYDPNEVDEKGNIIAKVLQGYTTFFHFGRYGIGFLGFDYVYPAPTYFFGGYDCIRIGNGTPSEYWTAYNLEHQGEEGFTPEFHSYIGDEIVTIYGSIAYPEYGAFRRYSDRYYHEFGNSPAPISAEYKDFATGRIITYTCNKTI